MLFTFRILRCFAESAVPRARSASCAAAFYVPLKNGAAKSVGCSLKLDCLGAGTFFARLFLMGMYSEGAHVEYEPEFFWKRKLWTIIVLAQSLTDPSVRKHFWIVSSRLYVYRGNLTHHEARTSNKMIFAEEKKSSLFLSSVALTWWRLNVFMKAVDTPAIRDIINARLSLVTDFETRIHGHYFCVQYFYIRVFVIQEWLCDGS